jgi:urease accessory protein
MTSFATISRYDARTLKTGSYVSATVPIDSWQAELRLRFAERDGKTFLVERSHRGPLVVQKSFHPEGDVCHTCIVHPPGGVVGGDSLTLNVVAETNARVLLTTPAATKFYRSDARVATQSQTFKANDAFVEWLPQETIYYRDAKVVNDIYVQLSARSRFIGWEVACLGLPARKEAFDVGHLALNWELVVGDQPRIVDRLRIDGSSDVPKSRWGLQGFEALGTMFVFPAERAWLEAIRNIQTADCELAVTLVDGVLVARCLAAQGESVKRMFIQIWQHVRPLLLKRSAVLPRIWAT